MEERTKKTLEECKKLELKLSEAEKEKKNVDKKYTQVCQYVDYLFGSESYDSVHIYLCPVYRISLLAQEASR